jgi:glycosyltransferase involved in cell wall biosynthesis
MRATIQLCTYNRAHLLERVLDACFEQSVASDTYEIVLVNDGSTDGTPAVIEAARRRASCAFTAITQSNAGLAHGRNVGLRASSGERIIFIDDDVLPMPNFVAEHLRGAQRDSDIVVRGAVIEVESFERLPPPIWSLRNYSANWFWTSNVSVSRRRLDAVGWFDESFSEYGWEDIELGLRLRAAGTRGWFNRLAVAFHCKPKPQAGLDLEALIRQKRAQARTARILARKHPGWRVALATGDNPVQRSVHRASRLLHLELGWRALLRNPKAAHLATSALGADAYFDELERSGS